MTEAEILGASIRYRRTVIKGVFERDVLSKVTGVPVETIKAVEHGQASQYPRSRVYLLIQALGFPGKDRVYMYRLANAVCPPSLPS